MYSTTPPPRIAPILTPYRKDKNLAKAYNEAIAATNYDEDTWIILTDADTMFIPQVVDYMDIIERAIIRYPDTGLFGCITNRVGKPWQTDLGRFYREKDPEKFNKLTQLLLEDEFGEYDPPPPHIFINEETDLLRLAKLMRGFADIYGDECEHADHISGHFMCFRKGIWQQMGGFDETKGGALDVDNTFSFQVSVQHPVRVMLGLYLIHWYRLATGRQDTKHLMP